jgi:acetolactate synthase-1/2/3 large subunit
VVEQLAEKTGAAVLATASGRGSFDEEHSQFLGLAGLYARPAVSELVRDADLVIALGSRLEETARFGWRHDQQTVQVNIDAAEFSTEFAGPRVLGDGGDVVRSWLGFVGEPDPQWLKRVVGTRQSLMDDAQAELARLRTSPRVRIAEVLAALQTVLRPDAILVQENGLQDMWSYIFPYFRCGGSIVPSEQTSLGFGAAAAGGVRLAQPDRQVVAFVGDGGLSMLMSELATAAKYALNVKVVVVKNNSLGQIKWEQMAFLGNPEYGCELHPIDFAAVAKACGVKGFSVSDPAQCGAVLREAFETSGPALVDCAVDGNEPPLPPKVSFKHARHMVEALARGTPDAGDIAKHLARDTVRQLI